MNSTLFSWLGATAQRPPLSLNVIDGSDSPKDVAVNSLPAIVGRNPCADISLADRWVSRIHSELRQVNNRIVVRDLESRHGTYVNGEPIREFTLSAGDEIIVGTSRLKVIAVDPTDVPPGD